MTGRSRGADAGDDRAGGLWGLTEERRAGVRALTAPGAPVGGTPGAPPTGTPGAPVGGTPERQVVIVPGLGALRYLMPFVRELSRRGTGATLLDLPGFGRWDGVGCAPSVGAVAEAAAAWCSSLEDDVRPVLFGHSTGAQAALRAAVRLQLLGRAPLALVLAGPTIAPNQRWLPRLIATTPAAYRRDSPVELGALGDYHGAGRDVLRLLRSAIADRPERTVRELTVPLLVTAGRHDAFAPAGWLVALAHAAPSRSTRVVRLPGSHNNPFTHPAALATVVESVASEACRLSRVRRPRRVRTVARVTEVGA